MTTHRRTPLATAMIAVGLTLTACTTGTDDSHPATPPPASGSSASTSGTAQAWVRGTKATVTNSTGAVQQISQTNDTTYTALAADSSFSLLDEWSSTSSTGVKFNWKVSDSLAFKIEFINSFVGTPVVQTCNMPKVTSNDCDEVYLMRNDVTFSENETQTLNLKNSNKDVVATITVTRNADDDDNKNWTATLDTNTAG